MIELIQLGLLLITGTLAFGLIGWASYVNAQAKRPRPNAGDPQLHNGPSKRLGHDAHRYANPRVESPQ